VCSQGEGLPAAAEMLWLLTSGRLRAALVVDQRSQMSRLVLQHDEECGEGVSETGVFTRSAVSWSRWGGPEGGLDGSYDAVEAGSHRRGSGRGDGASVVPFDSDSAPAHGVAYRRSGLLAIHGPRAVARPGLGASGACDRVHSLTIDARRRDVAKGRLTRPERQDHRPGRPT
jgi:hypothetical protein